MTNPSFVKTKEGLYRLRGAIEPDAIVKQAATLLLDKLCDGRELSSAGQSADFLRMALANEPYEQFAVLFLNSRNQVIAFETLFKGTIDCAAVHPRVVVHRGLTLNASALVVAHNHPSGELEPSDADRQITELLQEVLKLFDMRLLDHFIVTRQGCYSLIHDCLL